MAKTPANKPGARKRRWRGDNALPFVNASLIGGRGLLLDSCVYIDQIQDRLPQALDDLITQRQVNHSTVAIQELMHTIGVLRPSDPRTAVVAEIGGQIKAMPPHRIFAPDTEVLGRAALLSGILCRLQGYGTPSCGRSMTVRCSCRRRSSASWC